MQGGWMLATLHPAAEQRADDIAAAFATRVADLRLPELAAGQMPGAGLPPAAGPAPAP